MEPQCLILAALLTTRIKAIISSLQDYLGSPGSSAWGCWVQRRAGSDKSALPARCQCTARCAWAQPEIWLQERWGHRHKSQTACNPACLSCERLARRTRLRKENGPPWLLHHLSLAYKFSSFLFPITKTEMSTRWQPWLLIYCHLN